ncbi:unnamed protein product [Heligmosomoides polygyrus]|uniref:Chromo domain-containing protein n=1 Tax=Heligmosomoides polygyrus TaxID=6339 RepID=A0A183GQB9_HELPZ|nr:unnamed protein product [Heligmosomoides polygyrus]
MTEETPNAKPRRASLIKATENIKSATKTAPKRKRRDDEYEVEAILSHIVVDGVTIYSVSWVGYPGEITEMTEDELQNCSELLNAYKEKAKAAGDVGLFLPASAQDGFNGSAENHSSMNGFANAHSSSPEILTKYNEPVVLVSYKEPLPAGFEDKQDEIVPIRIIAEADPQVRTISLYELEQESPEYCWKYCGTSLIAQYHIEMAHQQGHHAYGGSSQLPVFYAVIPHFVSPFELSIQPKFLEKTRQKLLLKMAGEYSGDAEFNFASHQVGSDSANILIINTESGAVRGSVKFAETRGQVKLPLSGGVEFVLTPVGEQRAEALTTS